MSTGTDGMQKVLSVFKEVETLLDLTGTALLNRGQALEGGAASKIIALRLAGERDRLAAKEGAQLADVEPTVVPFLEGLVDRLSTLRESGSSPSALALASVAGGIRAVATQLRKALGEKAIAHALALAETEPQNLDLDAVTAAIERLNSCLPTDRRYQRPEIVRSEGLGSQSLDHYVQGDGGLNAYTDRARRVMALAHEKAKDLSHEGVGTEHILLALVQEGSGVGANALRNAGADLVMIQREVKKLAPPPGALCVMGRLPMTPRAKKVAELALDEANNLRHKHIGTEHLAIGLLREHDGVAAQALRNLGVSVEKLRAEVTEILGTESTGESSER